MSEPKSVSNFTIFSDENDVSGSLVDRLFNALWLITLGVVFLLNTFDILPWSMWGNIFIVFTRVWPLFIVGAGVSIIAGNSSVAKLVTGLLWYLGFLLVLFLAATDSTLVFNFDDFKDGFPESFVINVTNKFE